MDCVKCQYCSKKFNVLKLNDDVKKYACGICLTFLKRFDEPFFKSPLEKSNHRGTSKKDGYDLLLEYNINRMMR